MEVAVCGESDEDPAQGDLSQTLDPEEVLLGTVLAYPASGPEVLADLEEADFHRPVHRAVVGAMRQLIEAGAPCEPLLVAEQLVNHPSAQTSRSTHWYTETATLLGQASIPASARAYRRLLLTALWRRQAIAYAARVDDCARNGTVAELQETLGESMREIGLTLARLHQQAPTRRVLVTGPRVRWGSDHESAVTAVLDQLRKSHVRLVIVHGANKTGVDPIATAWAARNGIELEPHEPDWDTHAKAAGPRRTREMIRSRPDECHAFAHPAAPGDSGCASLSEQAGIPTIHHA